METRGKSQELDDDAWANHAPRDVNACREILHLILLESTAQGMCSRVTVNLSSLESASDNPWARIGFVVLSYS